MAQMALVGTIAVGDVVDAPPERIDALTAASPVLAITPTSVVPGPFDPGGWATRVNTAVQLGLPLPGIALLVRRLVRMRRTLSVAGRQYPA